MTRSWRAAAVLASAALAAGCASAAGTRGGSAPAAAASAPAPPSLTTALTAQGTSWAAVPMGAASGPNLFWQLFVRTAGSAKWSLATPPDVPTNGALILAGAGQHTLTAGVRPALALRFSPVTVTKDAGRSWTSGPPAAGLADVPDALATAPGGQMIALDKRDQASLGSATGTSWTTLTSQRALGRQPAVGCGLTALTAAAYTQAGTPLLAGNCTRPGVAGIFAYTRGAWHAAAPAVPASLSRQQIRVLRLTRTGDRDTALLQAGTGAAATLLAAWTSGSGGQWTVSAPLRLGGSQVISASFGDSGSAAAVLSGNRGAAIAGPGARWQALPALPSGRTVTLALPTAGGTDALAAAGSTLTVWHLAAGSARWARTQVTKVPVQYGSSA
jgi:hypothetical protein